jgi:cholesterol oxidase
VRMTAPLPPGIGLSFTERMSGTFTAGTSAPAPLEFRLTITFDDLAAMLASPRHAGQITGTVTAPTLSPQPLTTSGGVFNLFVDDPNAVSTRELLYEFVMRSADGRAFHFAGVKTVRDDRGLDMWADTTTLAITLRDGATATAPVLGTGVLHLSVEDFARELTTFNVTGTDSELLKLEAIARFGAFFAGRLYKTYGGVSTTSGVFDPTAPPRSRRPLDVGPPDVHFARTTDGVVLKLTRYRAGAKGPVLLVHGLGVSSLIFSMDTIRPNLLEYLFARDYDVWLLDYRSSVDLPYAHQAYTADDVALKDYPAAVAKVLEVTNAPSTQVVVHCFGATTFFMAMLAGLRGVRSAAVSQIATHVRVPGSTMVKAIFRVPEVLDALGVKEMTTDARTDESFLEKVGDLLLKLYPVHDGPRDTSAVSRRISFIYGQLYEIANLNQSTYDHLDDMFGVASIASLEHLTAMIRAGKIVAADGGDVYLREADGYPTLNRLAIPITIVHGELNKCWKPESTVITYELLRRHNDPNLYTRVPIPGYGHIDCIFGKDAARDVYPYILTHLDATATV